MAGGHPTILKNQAAATKSRKDDNLQDKPKLRPREKFVLVALSDVNLRGEGNGLKIGDLSREIREELKDPSSALRQAFEELGLNKKKVSTPQFSIGAIYTAMKKLKEYGLIKTCPGFPRDRYAPTVAGNEIAYAFHESFKKTDPSIYGTVCKNLYSSINLGPVKFNQKLRMKMREVTILTRYELHNLLSDVLVFICVNNKGAFNRHLGRATYVWAVPVSKLYWGILDVVHARIKRLGGVELELKKTHEGFENNALIIKYDHHKLVEMVGHPVEIEHKIKTMIKKRTTEIFFKIPYPTRGFVTRVDYTETEYQWVNVEHSFDEEPIIEHSPDKKIIKVSMNPNVLIYPRQGITFSFGKD